MFLLIKNDTVLRALKACCFSTFQSLTRSRDSAFSAAINFDNLSRRPCTRGTRVNIIKQVMTWANEDPTKVPPVYWLTGLAGLSKTTIAYTICKLLNEAQLPFASLFCSHQLDSRLVVDACLRIQIVELLAKPWQASVAQQTDRDLPAPTVVVDALDECDRGVEFLEEPLQVIRASQLAGIKFLVTSRPHPKIVDFVNHSLRILFVSSTKSILPMSKTTLRSTCGKQSQN